MRRRPIRRLLARVFPNPHLSGCGRCGYRWNVARWHDTEYGNGRGCFPLCTDCWAELTPEQRLPYYRELWESWEAGYAMEGRADLAYGDGTYDSPRGPVNYHRATWDEIEAAVLAGK